MARRPIGTESAPTKAAIESLAIQLQHILEPDQLIELLLQSVETALQQFENPEDSPERKTAKYKKPADAYKLKLLFRTLISKLITTSDFTPSGELCEIIELKPSEVEILRRESAAKILEAHAAEVKIQEDAPTQTHVPETALETSEEPEWDDLFSDYVDYKEPTYEDLKEVFQKRIGSGKPTFGVLRKELSGFGPCLILGYVFTKDMLLRRPLAITVPNSDGTLLYDDKMFNYVDSLIKTIREEVNGKVYLIKILAYRVNTKGRCWLNKKGNRDDPNSKVYFICRADGVEWVDADTYYAFVVRPEAVAAE